MQAQQHELQLQSQQNNTNTTQRGTKKNTKRKHHTK